MRVLTLPIPRVDALAFAPDGAELAAGGCTRAGEGRGLIVFPVGAGPAAGRRRLDGLAVAGIAYAPGGRLLVAGGDIYHRTVALLHPTGDPDQVLNTGVFEAAAGRLLGGRRGYGEDASAFACRRLTADGSLAPLWDVALGHGHWPAAASLLPDGRAVTLVLTSPFVTRDPPALCLRAADTGRELQTVTPPGQAAVRLYASPDGEQVVLNAGKSLFVWRTADLAAPPRKITFGTKSCTGVGFVPGGLLAAGNDGTVRRLGPAGDIQATYTFTDGKVRSLAVAPDGLTAAVGTDRGTVIVFDLD